MRQHPFLKIFLRNHVQISPHPIMSEAAQLRAGNLILPDLGRREVDRNAHSRNHVLLYSEFADVKAVDHILSIENKIDRSVHWKYQFGTYNVISCIDIVGAIESEVVAHTRI